MKTPHLRSEAGGAWSPRGAAGVARLPEVPCFAVSHGRDDDSRLRANPNGGEGRGENHRAELGLGLGEEGSGGVLTGAIPDKELERERGDGVPPALRIRHPSRHLS